MLFLQEKQEQYSKEDNKEKQLKLCSIIQAGK